MDAMWQALDHLPLSVPNLRNRESVYLNDEPFNAHTVPYNRIDPELATLIQDLDISHVASIKACERFESEGESYWAVLEEGHFKTLRYDIEMRVRQGVNFTSDELEAKLRILFEALRALLDRKLLYRISIDSVVICKTQVKLGRVWTCELLRSEEQKQEAIECFSAFVNEIIIVFPTAYSPAIEAFLESILRPAVIPAEEPSSSRIDLYGNAETVPVPEAPPMRDNYRSGVASTVVQTKHQPKVPRPMEYKSCQCVLS